MAGEHDRAVRVLTILLGLAIPLSVIHYTDNYTAYEVYPKASAVGIEVTQGLVGISWFVFTFFGLLGYWLYRRGRIVAGCVCLVVYSTTGLISIGHYSVPGMSELAWWRHVSIWIDVTLGAAVLLFAVWSTMPSHLRALSRPG